MAKCKHRRRDYANCSFKSNVDSDSEIIVKSSNVINAIEAKDIITTPIIIAIVFFIIGHICPKTYLFGFKLGVSSNFFKISTNIISTPQLVNKILIYYIIIG